MIGFWRPYPFFVPRKEGRYLCTAGGATIDLYFQVRDKQPQWIDKRRQNAIDGYKCYKQGREPLEYNRIFTDSRCVRDDVTAWMPVPKPRKSKEKK